MIVSVFSTPSIAVVYSLRGWVVAVDGSRGTVEGYIPEVGREKFKGSQRRVGIVSYRYVNSSRRFSSLHNHRQGRKTVTGYNGYML